MNKDFLDNRKTGEGVSAFAQAGGSLPPRAKLPVPVLQTMEWKMLEYMCASSNLLRVLDGPTVNGCIALSSAVMCLKAIQVFSELDVLKLPFDVKYKAYAVKMKELSKKFSNYYLTTSRDFGRVISGFGFSLAAPWSPDESDFEKYQAIFDRLFPDCRHSLLSLGPIYAELSRILDEIYHKLTDGTEIYQRIYDCVLKQDDACASIKELAEDLTSEYEMYKAGCSPRRLEKRLLKLRDEEIRRFRDSDHGECFNDIFDEKTMRVNAVNTGRYIFDLRNVYCNGREMRLRNVMECVELHPLFRFVCLSTWIANDLLKIAASKTSKKEESKAAALLSEDMQKWFVNKDDIPQFASLISDKIFPRINQEGNKWHWRLVYYISHHLNILKDSCGEQKFVRLVNALCPSTGNFYSIMRYPRYLKTNKPYNEYETRKDIRECGDPYYKILQVLKN